MTQLTKKYVWDETKPPVKYRPGTSDESIIQTVMVEKREYGFPQFKPKLIFDIGANIGVVSVIMANVYPEATICAFEPVKENYDLLVENTSHYKNVITHHCGLGDNNRNLKIYKSDDARNLGGFSTEIVGEVGEEVRITRVKTYLQRVGVPDLIKIDCEGAEWEIFNDFHPDELKKVKWITGELHGVNEFLVLDRLSKAFHIATHREFGDKVWHFHALNRENPQAILGPVQAQTP